jgi:hypothetical protein
MTPLPTSEHFDSMPNIGGSDTSLGQHSHVNRIKAASVEHEKDGRSMIAEPDFQTETRGAPSCARVDPNDMAFTLATQLSDERLWMMQHHCAGWKSDIALAILTSRTQESVEHELRTLGCGRNLALRILPKKDFQSGDYPVNILRNLAISAVKTSHFLYIDSDFWLSHRTDAILMKREVREILSMDSKQALVLPAYQLRYNCKNKNDPLSCRSDKVPLVPKTKLQLIKGFNAGNVTIFDPKNPNGHGSTLYDLWVAQRSGTTVPIPCLKSDRYEPYLVVQHCRELPPCQEQFTGYGKNKISVSVAWLLITPCDIMHSYSK